jgi:hypothetical protein
MGDKTMSDIEKRIEQWRAGLAGSELLGGSDVNELESHLRDESAQLKASGLSEDEAFVIASRRLGDGPALEAEFAKAHPHRRLAHGLYWSSIGVLGYFLVVRITLLASWVPAWLAYAAGLRNLWCLVAFAGVSRVAFFALLPLLALKYYRSRAQATPRNAPISIRLSVLIAGAIVSLWWIVALLDPVLRLTMSHEGFAHVASASFWAGFGWEILMPFLLVAVLVVLTVRRKSSAGQNAIGSISSDRAQKTGELESYLREEIRHLTALGLSDEEASLIARHRLGETHMPEGEFSEALLLRQRDNRLCWMVIGVLGYLLAVRISTLASVGSACLGYAAGVRNAWLTLAMGTMQVAVFAFIVILALRYHASHAQAVAQRTWALLCAGLFIAATTVASWWVMNSAHPFLYRRMSEDGFVQVIRAWHWAGFGWNMLMPFLAAGLIAILGLRDRRHFAIQ